MPDDFLTDTQANPAPPISSDTRPPTRSGVRRLGGCGARAALSVAALAAVGLILLLVGAWAATQFGPGGIMSDVRPGAEAPDFEVPLLDGGTVRLSEYRGRPVALNFWATWCPPCILELPLLIQAGEDYGDGAGGGLAVLALNAGQTREHIEWFIEDHSLEVPPVALDPGRKVYEMYGVVGLPTTVWIDDDGVVSAVELGVLTPELISSYMEELVGSAP